MKPFYDLLTSTSSDFTLNSLVKIEPFIDDLMIYNKCTAFYHNAEDFFEDRVFTASDGTKRLFIDGRIVVVGDIYFKEPIYFEGSGILTALAYSKTKKRGNILIGGHFLKAPGAPTNAYITLFAPHGKILVSNPNAKIQAALFALNMNFTSGNRDLHGYLIGAGKQILRNGHMQIQGSLCVDRLNLPTFPTSTTITYDPALIPSTDAADRHRDYHVSLSQTFNYWRRQGI
jgi:hypothetical protein